MKSVKIFNLENFRLYGNCLLKESRDVVVVMSPGRALHSEMVWWVEERTLKHIGDVRAQGSTFASWEHVK